MLYRSGMRRGISLEVIVEEDDRAEVSLDPQSSHLEHERDSSPTSCSSNESKVDCWDQNDEFTSNENCNYEKLKEEQKKRKKKKETDERWRRLGKQRSLSCEILTILDVGDDDLSQEQWEKESRDWDLDEDYDDDDSFKGHKPVISRLKILKNNLENKNPDDSISDDETNYFRCNGEEMSVDGDNDDELESKIDFEEEDHLSSLEDEIKSSTEDHLSGREAIEFQEIKINTTTPIFQLQDLTEFDPDVWITVGDLSGDKEPGNKEPRDNQEEHSNNDLKEQNSESKRSQKEVTFSDEVQIEILENYDSHMDECYEDLQNEPIESSLTSFPDIIDDHFPSVKNVKSIFDIRKDIEKPSILEKLANVLDPPVILVEENNSQSSQSNVKIGHEVPINEKETKVKSSKSIHNKELYPEELPPPRTVASVRQLFERVPISIPRIDSPYSSSRDKFDHVRSNPTSKILRFGRDKRDKKYQSNSLNYRSEELHRNKLFDAENYKSASLPRSQKTNIDNSESKFNFANSKLDFMDTQPRSVRKDVNNPSNVVEDKISNTSNGTVGLSKECSSPKVSLRKPKVVSRFNVRKALEESPIYFHIRIEDKKDRISTNNTIEKTATDKEQISSNSNFSKRLDNVITSNYEWSSKETIDRSDAESISSETSEDSGVSKDFNSSILNKFSSKIQDNSKNNKKRLSQELTLDHSFMLIDPNVLAKIRSLGTTVLFFGPRRSNNKSGSSCRGNYKQSETLNQQDSFSTSQVTSNNQSTSNKKSNRTHKQTKSLKSNEIGNKNIHTNELPSAETSEMNTPRVVGVVHKKNENSHVENICASPTKKFVKGKSSFGNNSIIFDFTSKITTEN